MRELEQLEAVHHAGALTAEQKSRLETLSLQLVAFDYVDDPDGAKCPFGAHTGGPIRAAVRVPATCVLHACGADQSPPHSETRVTYGSAEEIATDAGDHGIIMLILNADLGRQFEFVQQQWVNFGNDFRLSNDKDPLIGNHAIPPVKTAPRPWAVW